MSSDKARSALGLAKRAGKCLSGDFIVERAVKDGRARLVVLDALASEATKRRYVELCDRQGITCLEFQDMGPAIGKPGCRIAAVTGEDFAAMIINKSKDV